MTKHKELVLLVLEANRIVHSVTAATSDEERDRFIGEFKAFDKANPGLMAMMNDLVTISESPVRMEILTDREKEVVSAMIEAKLLKLVN